MPVVWQQNNHCGSCFISVYHVPINIYCLTVHTILHNISSLLFVAQFIHFWLEDDWFHIAAAVAISAKWSLSVYEKQNWQQKWAELVHRTTKLSHSRSVHCVICDQIMYSAIVSSSWQNIESCTRFKMQVRDMKTMHFALSGGFRGNAIPKQNGLWGDLRSQSDIKSKLWTYTLWIDISLLEI